MVRAQGTGGGGGGGGGYSGFQFTGMIKGFFGFEIVGAKKYFWVRKFGNFLVA